jgi:hypothetical protein
MKLRLASLCLLALCLTLVALPVTAQTVYSNGPTNGNTSVWDIFNPYIVSDTFNVSNNHTAITGADFAVWLFPGNTLLAAELSITSGENGGTTYFDQFVDFTQNDCVVNRDMLDVCQEHTSFSGPTLNSGVYWLNVQNTDVEGSAPHAYWDENSGPSSASENEVGTIPSESFTLLGGSGSTTTTGTVPEASSIVLFGSGFLGVVGLLRHKLL